MLATIARFEISKRLRQLSTYVYFLLFFAIAFLVIIAAGGAFAGANIVVGGSGGKTLVNSPLVLGMLISVISYFGMIVMAAVMGQAVYQDFHHQTHTLFFTSPISKWDYLGGRFVGSLVVLAFIFLSLAAGAWVGTLMPFVDRSMFGVNRLPAYIQPYLIIVWPNMIFIGAVFFSLAALMRRILPVYVASVVFLIGYLIAGTLAGDVERKFLASLLDPFGLNAVSYVTQYWTVAERNTRNIPFSGVVIWNRLVWMAMSGLLLGGVCWRFRFQHGGERSRGTDPDPTLPTPVPIAIPVTSRRDFRALRLLPGSVWLNFKETVKNIYFAVILLAGVLFMVLAAQTMGSIYGTETYPVTATVLELVGGSFMLFVLIIITFYAGELVWRERDANIHQLCDVLPVPNWLPLVSKIVALGLVQVLLLCLVMATGMAIQACQGYFRFETSVYARDLFGIKLIDFLLLSVLAIAVQVVVNHKYLGHFVMVLYYLANAFMDRFGWEHNLYDYAGRPSYTYSDMNGFGHFVAGIIWFDMYWACGALLLAIVSNCLWVRGTESSLRCRLRVARDRCSRVTVVAAGVAMAGFATIGSYIFYNTNVLNRFETRQVQRERMADYERTYKHLEKKPQPRITDVQVTFDLFPERRDLRTRGTLMLENKSGQPIPDLYVEVVPDLKIHKLSAGELTEPSSTDSRQGIYTFHLPQPLAPGATMPLAFDLELDSRGFRNDSGDTQVVYNGTFFNSTLLPHLGYSARRELSDDQQRRKQGLPPRERMAPVDDLAARRNNYISHDADWISLDAVVSTSPDQIAIVPGYLRKEWTEAGRRFFHYQTEGRILHFFSVLSARYEVRRDRWRGPVAFGKSTTAPTAGTAAAPAAGKTGPSASSSLQPGAKTLDPLAGTERDVAIEVYYQRGHEYNLERMIEAIKASLDYCARNFSPYQHRQVRIIEFPRYASFAQSFPNTIPYSESAGFIARVDPNDPKDVDYPYYITAHEIAHQWWAHQVIGGNVQGATVMSETLAQYAALMVMKHRYGAEQMKRFLRYELDRYLIGRGIERKKELPLALNENQGYVHYNKGSLVMYALQDYLGEERVNQALASYVREVGYQEPPYTNSRELLVQLRRVTPPEMQYLIEDLFETITLFDNRAVTAEARLLQPGQYSVRLEVSANKLRADEQGREIERPLDDLIDIGVFDALDKPLYLEKHRVQGKTPIFTITVNGVPAKAGVDPLNKLIDRLPDDNVVRVDIR